MSRGIELLVEVEVKLIDFRRAIRRLLTRLPDERGSGCEEIGFVACGTFLDMHAGSTTETVEARIFKPGSARIPAQVFQGIARALPFHKRNVISISFWIATVRINQTEYRHPDIFAQPIRFN